MYFYEHDAGNYQVAAEQEKTLSDALVRYRKAVITATRDGKHQRTVVCCA